MDEIKEFIERNESSLIYAYGAEKEHRATMAKMHGSQWCKPITFREFCQHIFDDIKSIGKKS